MNYNVENLASQIVRTIEGMTNTPHIRSIEEILEVFSTAYREGAARLDRFYSLQEIPGEPKEEYVSIFAAPPNSFRSSAQAYLSNSAAATAIGGASFGVVGAIILGPIGAISAGVVGAGFGYGYASEIQKTGRYHLSLYDLIDDKGKLTVPQERLKLYNNDGWDVSVSLNKGSQETQRVVLAKDVVF